jgi:hypothetical protein
MYFSYPVSAIIFSRVSVVGVPIGRLMEDGYFDVCLDQGVSLKDCHRFCEFSFTVLGEFFPSHRES